MKQIKLKKSDQLIFHPAVINVAKFAQSFSCLFNESILQTLSAEIINSVYIDVMKVDFPTTNKTTYAIINPMHIAVKFEDKIIGSCPTVFLFNDNEFTHDEIEYRAWVTLLSIIMMSPDQTLILNQLQQELNAAVPQSILKKNFGCVKISQSLLANFTGHDVNTIKAQRKKQIKKSTYIDSFDGFPTDFNHSNLKE